MMTMGRQGRTRTILIADDRAEREARLRRLERARPRYQDNLEDYDEYGCDFGSDTSGDLSWADYSDDSRDGRQEFGCDGSDPISSKSGCMRSVLSKFCENQRFSFSSHLVASLISTPW